MTERPRHTPGPYEDYFEGRTIVVGDTATHTDLAEFFYEGEHTVSTSREEAEANARLFIAAPDLLDALADMQAGWRYIRAFHGDLAGVGWDRCEDNATKSIAKARGEA